jgi:hypothetical protein
MKRRDRRKTVFHDKTIYYDISKRGWAIVVMPDSIRIDNFYLPSHLHVKIYGIHIPIKYYKEMDEVGLILKCHIARNNGKINLEELKKELVC